MRHGGVPGGGGGSGATGGGSLGGGGGAGGGGGGDPLAMVAADDYAELCDLGPSRWSSRGYHPPHSSMHHHHSASAAAAAAAAAGHHHGGGGGVGSSSASATHHRSNSFEADDGGGGGGGGVAYGTGSTAGAVGSRAIGNSTSSLRGGRSGLYYSPPGTSYTIVERPHSPHYYYNQPPGGGTGGGGGGISSTGISTATKSASRSAQHVPSGGGGGGSGGTSVPSSTSRHHNGGSHGGKKQPISPEQVIRLFGTTTSSSSVPTNYHYSNGGAGGGGGGGRDLGGGGAGGRDRGRRSPASSPPSTTHQSYRERERDRSVPNIHELSTRTVTMSRDQQDGHGFGICVKGGKDSGVGVYISRIEEGSLAERAGLRPGDTILEVNGTPFTSISHEEALKRCVQILKSSRQISMTVRAPPTLNTAAPLHGFGPPLRGGGGGGGGGVDPGRGADGGGAIGAYSQPFRQTCSWFYPDGRPASPPMEYGGRRHERRDRLRRVEIQIGPGESLGLMIRGGGEYGLGIFVTGVDKGSVAERSGLLIGDLILEVDGQSFLEITHDEAVNQLKYRKRMSLVVRDVGKVPHSCTFVEPEPWDAYSPTGTRSRRKCPISAMVEEKARSLLSRQCFASLSYFIAEYGARVMTIDAFVSVLLEMLDTPEKHTLVTEIRELVFPEDRTRYDELVYHRRDAYLTDRDRHRVSEVDLEVMAATNRTEAATSDIKTRPQAPLPHRPMSAGPILHQHQYQLQQHQHQHQQQIHVQMHSTPQPTTGHGGHRRLMGGSHNDIPRYMVGGGGGGRGGGGGGGGHRGGGFVGAAVGAHGFKDYDDARSRRGSETQIHRSEYDPDSGGYFGGIRSQLGGLTQRVKSWYWGRPLELATKLSRSFDMKADGGGGGVGFAVGSHRMITATGSGVDKCVRRHQSMQRLSTEPNGGSANGGPFGPGAGGVLGGGGGLGATAGGDTSGGGGAGNLADNPNVVSDNRGNLHITVKKTKPILGIAIEGGANTKHPLPRIINIHEHGAAFETGGMEVGQLILEVDDNKVEGMHHQDVARFIAECFASRDKPDITFLVVEAKKSNLEPKPPALIFLEA